MRAAAACCGNGDDGERSSIGRQLFDFAVLMGRRRTGLVEKKHSGSTARARAMHKRCVGRQKFVGDLWRWSSLRPRGSGGAGFFDCFGIGALER